MADADCEMEVTNKEESKTLIVLLAINGSMAVIESTAGWYAESTGLLADALDMLADALVYCSALYAIGKSVRVKIHSALLSGGLQLLLGFVMISEIVRRFIYGSEPISFIMISVSVIALAANILCLVLLNKHKHGEVHMRATWIFSRNDVIANLGVITAGLLVAYLGSPLPDLIIGSVISTVVLHGSYRIIREARLTKKGINRC